MKEKIQWIAWESCKLIFIIAFVISICCNIIWMYSFNDVKRGQDALYDAIHTNHEEVKQIILEQTKDGK